MNIRVLVTGANGQLGQTFKELYSNEHTFDFIFETKSSLDIASHQQVKSYFNKHKFNYCINCAAYTNVELAESNPEEAFKVNAEAVKNLAEACKENNVILIHISTDYVFNGEKQFPYTEDDNPNPINEYGKSKLAGEKYIQEIKPNYIIIRTSWLYSKYERNFLKTIIKKIENNESLQITTSQTGVPTSCIDLTEFIFYLIKNKTHNSEIFHFSPKGKTTWYDYALQICKHFKNYDCKKIIPIKNFKSQALRPKYSILDNTKAVKVFQKQISWKKRVNKTVKHFI